MDKRQMLDLDGKAILVTGASSGLGRHFALALAGQGAAVVAAARRGEELERLVAEGGAAHAVVMDVTDAGNLKGAWGVATEVARRWVAAGQGGAIVNIASVLGLRQGGQLSAYATSKAGLVQLTKQMALEWARHGIRVNALAPGYIETDLNRGFFETEAGKAMLKRIPQRRLGRPEDLDGALALLLSDASSYITGAVLAVDGGHLVSSL
jgi:NAD(P)-dependent dehydrogenase (short-subunit alcohol dehydrogenase family)